MATNGSRGTVGMVRPTKRKGGWCKAHARRSTRSAEFLSAVDSAGNQSATSVIVRVPDMKYMALADDRVSWYECNANMANQLRAAWSGKLSSASRTEDSRFVP